MAENSKITRTIEKLIAAVMENHLPQMQKELAQRILQETGSSLGNSSASQSGVADLLRAVTDIHAGSNQKEILAALLDSSTQFCGRAALFVVKSGSANGWQGRSFENADDIKNFTLDVHSPAVVKVLESHCVLPCKVSEMDGNFTAQFGAPSDEKILLLPLLLKEKVAALVYADGGCGSDSTLDQAALQLLVATTGAWLEVMSVRKHAAKESVHEHEPEAAPEPEHKAGAYSDPFAAHAPKHAVAASAGSAASALVGTASAAAAAPAPDPFADLSPEDAEIHRKAQRFARLLIDEVKLYNQAKVAEGRKNKDLYDRLKEDIEKSRATYLKRYGNTGASRGDYLNAEIVRSLAGDDASVLGPNFHR